MSVGNEKLGTSLFSFRMRWNIIRFSAHIPGSFLSAAFFLGCMDKTLNETNSIRCLRKCLGLGLLEVCLWEVRVFSHLGSGLLCNQCGTLWYMGKEHIDVIFFCGARPFEQTRLVIQD